MVTNQLIKEMVAIIKLAQTVSYLKQQTSKQKYPEEIKKVQDINKEDSLSE